MYLCFEGTTTYSKPDLVVWVEMQWKNDVSLVTLTSNMLLRHEAEEEVTVSCFCWNCLVLKLGDYEVAQSSRTVMSSKETKDHLYK